MSEGQPNMLRWKRHVLVWLALSGLSIRTICFPNKTQLRSAHHLLAIAFQSPLRISDFLQLQDLFSDLKGDRQEELRTETHIRTKTLCKLFRGVFCIVYIPLELVSVDDAAHTHVQLYYANLLQIYLSKSTATHMGRHLSRHHFVAPEIFDLTFHLLHDVVLKSLRQIVLVNQKFCEGF